MVCTSTFRRSRFRRPQPVRSETLPKRSGEVGGYLLKQAIAPQNLLNECSGNYAQQSGNWMKYMRLHWPLTDTTITTGETI